MSDAACNLLHRFASRERHLTKVIGKTTTPPPRRQSIASLQAQKPDAVGLEMLQPASSESTPPPPPTNPPRRQSIASLQAQKPDAVGLALLQDNTSTTTTSIPTPHIFLTDLDEMQYIEGVRRGGLECVAFGELAMLWARFRVVRGGGLRAGLRQEKRRGAQQRKDAFRRELHATMSMLRKRSMEACVMSKWRNYADAVAPQHRDLARPAQACLVQVALRARRLASHHRATENVAAVRAALTQHLAPTETGEIASTERRLRVGLV